MMTRNLIVLLCVVACGKSATQPASGSGSGSGSATGSGSDDVPAIVVGSGSGKPKKTDADLERFLRESLAMFKDLAGATGKTCADKAKAMHAALDKYAALLATLGEKPDSPDISDRSKAIADRNHLTEELQLAVIGYESAKTGCEKETKSVDERLEAAAR